MKYQRNNSDSRRRVVSRRPLIVGLVALLSATVVIGSVTGGSATRALARASAPPAAPARAVSSSLRRHFGIFRDTPRGGRVVEALISETPALISDMAHSPAAPPFMQGSSMSNLRSQVVGSPGSTHPVGTVWTIPGPGGACVAARIAGESGGRVVGTCNTAAVAATAGLTGTLYNKDGTTTMFGLMPDGNVSADIRPANGRRMTAPVRDNVFMVTIATHLRGVRIGAKGATSR